MPKPGNDSSTRQQLNGQLAERAMRRGSGIAVHRPVVVYLQIASGCNLDCYMCSEHNLGGGPSAPRDRRSMKPEVFEVVEKEILPWSTRVSFGIGGEPTISEHFGDFVRRVADAGQFIQLTTNGTRFDRGEIAEMVARNVSDLQVSVDAARGPTYERIRRGASWNRMLRGLERLNEFRERGPADARCRVTLCFTLMRSNVEELPAFVELASRMHADGVHAQHVIPVTAEGRAESLIDEPTRYDRVREEAVARARDLGMPFELPKPYEGGNGSPVEPAPVGEVDPGPLAGYVVPCSHPNQSVYVLHDGRVFSCCHPFAHEKMQVGNLGEQRFAEIWNHRLMRNLRAGLCTGDVPTICRECSLAHDPPLARENPDAARDDSDLAGYYGGRDLDPLDGDSHDWLERTGLLDYLADLRETVRTLETERPQLVGHAATLKAELEQLRAHAATLDDERRSLLEHSAVLDLERPQLFAHAEAIERELGALRDHTRILGMERARLLEHLATIEAERQQLLAHVSNLEAERPHLRGHIANLERQRRGPPLARHVVRTLCGERVAGFLDRIWRAVRVGSPPEKR